MASSMCTFAILGHAIIINTTINGPTSSSTSRTYSLSLSHSPPSCSLPPSSSRPLPPPSATPTPFFARTLSLLPCCYPSSSSSRATSITIPQHPLLRSLYGRPPSRRRPTTQPRSPHSHVHPLTATTSTTPPGRASSSLPLASISELSPCLCAPIPSAEICVCRRSFLPFVHASALPCTNHDYATSPVRELLP